MVNKCWFINWIDQPCIYIANNSLCNMDCMRQRYIQKCICNRSVRLFDMSGGLSKHTKYCDNINNGMLQ